MISVEANIDPVTNLLTRRRFNTAIEKATESAGREGQPLSPLLIDINHFKRFNDHFGHLVGDSVL
jgi:diguanylate cyclase (GGDEF)-like protein